MTKKSPKITYIYVENILPHFLHLNSPLNINSLSLYLPAYLDAPSPSLYDSVISDCKRIIA